MAFGELSGSDQGGASAVGQGRGRAGGDSAIFAEGRLKGGQSFERCGGAQTAVALDE